MEAWLCRQQISCNSKRRRKRLRGNFSYPFRCHSPEAAAGPGSRGIVQTPLTPAVKDGRQRLTAQSQRQSDVRRPRAVCAVDVIPFDPFLEGPREIGRRIIAQKHLCRQSRFSVLRPMLPGRRRPALPSAPTALNVAYAFITLASHNPAYSPAGAKPLCQWCSTTQSLYRIRGYEMPEVGSPPLDPGPALQSARKKEFEITERGHTRTSPSLAG
ncbi:hypothetical protein GGTG_11386 [Gaeumannomyces tritici R3-111a-1]|uniref:Uncharacterized protein n=1 Tax=Gaeumannomyces tritici (strain R3-111a-1) TaxID=644352 RepID=J3PD13_GAET3|nr:hypothetical protein GGTG_11386 [Gaeumannomyces tritici R3-111a-1]EJT70358.1 hypothetical protein GGTG_11386 [Gaeumannomyces tritici R3-111a-1]